MAKSVQWLSYELDDGGIVFFFSFSSGGIVLDSSGQLSDRLFSYPTLCPVGSQDDFSRGHSKRCVKLTTLIRLMPDLRMVVLYLQSWLRLLV